MKVLLSNRLGLFHMTPAAYALYAEKRGFRLYAYTRTILDEESVYFVRKPDISTTRKVDFYSRADLGPVVPEEKVDWTLGFHLDSVMREDPTLIEVVEALGEKATFPYERLRVDDIPEDQSYVINMVGGAEQLRMRNGKKVH